MQDTGLKHLHKVKMMDADGAICLQESMKGYSEPQAECETPVVIQLQKGKHINKDIRYKTQEVRHGLKPDFEWGIVSSLSITLQKKMKIN